MDLAGGGPTDRGHLLLYTRQEKEREGQGSVETRVGGSTGQDKSKGSLALLCCVCIWIMICVSDLEEPPIPDDEGHGALHAHVLLCTHSIKHITERGGKPCELFGGEATRWRLGVMESSTLYVLSVRLSFLFVPVSLWLWSYRRRSWSVRSAAPRRDGAAPASAASHHPSPAQHTTHQTHTVDTSEPHTKQGKAHTQAGRQRTRPSHPSSTSPTCSPLRPMCRGQ